MAVLPGDVGGCGTYRMRMPAEAVAKIRPDWNVRVYPPKGHVQIGLDSHGRVVTVRNFDPWPDVLVLQRTGNPVLVAAARWLQERGVAIVTDFDDAMWCIDRDNAAYAAWNNPQRHRGQHWRLCDQSAGFADLVTVTTDKLARHYGAHGRVEILPNRIPQQWVTATPVVDGVPSGGWAGYTKTHPGDCAVSAPAARVFHTKSELRVMADPMGAAREWGIDPGEVVGIDSTPTLGPDYFAGVARVGVMLVGLTDSPFNRCKSTLKVLEAGAAGIPAIAAATDPHVRLQRDGFPVRVARTPAEWETHALDLCDPDTYRRACVEVQAAMSGYTVESQAEAWAQAWERAAKRRAAVAA